MYDRQVICQLLNLIEYRVIKYSRNLPVLHKILDLKYSTLFVSTFRDMFIIFGKNMGKVRAEFCPPPGRRQVLVP